MLDEVDEVGNYCDNAPVDTISLHERRVVERFAAGELQLKRQAYAVYYSYKGLSCPVSAKHLAFMKEIVEPTNLRKRMIYRSQLLDSLT